jgi:hypothetical protein
MALGTSSFGTILQASSENFFVNNANIDNTQTVASTTAVANPVETAGSIAWGGFDVCELSTTTAVDYTAYTTPPVETAGSIASATTGSYTSTPVISVSVASVSTSTSGCACSYSC